ncbi:MAG: hypothetical protein PQJ61_00865 [Spirochaetales bacterium]|uniref:Uncharacterized protein n=1 Tax=Candidatus Thalassospirochaeta sargassi TaxID=3119039 RepID=A0AAJ1I9T3_9SPIO|nr:hypothetical protein [Spirochaetales bacterium]
MAKNFYSYEKRQNELKKQKKKQEKMKKKLERKKLKAEGEPGQEQESSIEDVENNAPVEEEDN